jgi:hypothetical protein
MDSGKIWLLLKYVIKHYRNAPLSCEEYIVRCSGYNKTDPVFEGMYGRNPVFIIISQLQ